MLSIDYAASAAGDTSLIIQRVKLYKIVVPLGKTSIHFSVNFHFAQRIFHYPHTKMWTIRFFKDKSVNTTVFSDSTKYIVFAALV